MKLRDFGPKSSNLFAKNFDVLHGSRIAFKKIERWFGNPFAMTAESLDVELSVPLGMSRMYLADPIDLRTADALFREAPEDEEEEEDEDEIKDDEEEDDEEEDDEEEDDEGEEVDDEEEGDGYSR